MKLHLVRGDNEALVVGGTWNIAFYTTDENGWVVSSNPVLTISKPDGTTEEFDTGARSIVTWESLVGDVGSWNGVLVPTGTDSSVSVEPGVYLFPIDINQTGRWVAEISADETPNKYITAYALPVTTESQMPVVGDAAKYIDIAVDVDLLEGLFEAEKAAQRARCRIPAAYPPDLRVALLRRTKRAWEMRRNSSASDADSPFTGYTPQNDPEVRRLEAPYRKVVLG